MINEYWNSFKSLYKKNQQLITDPLDINRIEYLINDIDNILFAETQDIFASKDYMWINKVYEFIILFFFLLLKYYDNSLYYFEILQTHCKRLDKLIKHNYPNYVNIKRNIIYAYLKSFIYLKKKNVKFLINEDTILDDIKNGYKNIIKITIDNNCYNIIDHFNKIENLKFYESINSYFGLKLKDNIKSDKLKLRLNK